MADVLHVSRQDMEAASSKFKQEAENFATSVRALQTQAQSLQDTWKGSGSEGFGEQYINLNKGFDTTQQAIMAISQALDKTLAHYTEQDQQIHGIWSGASSNI